MFLPVMVYILNLTFPVILLIKRVSVPDVVDVVINFYIMISLIASSIGDSPDKAQQEFALKDGRIVTSFVQQFDRITA